MSYYYNYSIGIKTKDDKIYPLGPFNADGKVLDVITNSRSYEPEKLHEDFLPVSDNQKTPELIEAYSHELIEAYSYDSCSLKYLPIGELPKGDGLRSGYFLISDVVAYKADPNNMENLFYDWMDAETYLSRAANEERFGPPLTEKDEEGYDITPKSCRDYMPFAYIDINSAEYMAEKIRFAASMYNDWDLINKFGADYTIVVLLTEG